MKRYFVIISMWVFASALLAESATARIDKNLTIYTDVMRQLDINYVDTLNYDDLIETSINQMLRKVDPYTLYIPKSDDDELRRMTQGKYGGVGSLIMYRDSNVYVSELYEGMPAQLAGLLPGLFGGSMIIEQVFGIDGIGNIAYKALNAGDIPFVMGYNMFLAVLTVLGMLITDVMYVLVDPRVKLK